MGQTGFFHHIGSFLLFSATILLIITCISAPVVHNLSVLKVNLANNNNDFNPDITFGTFGYCVSQSSGNDDCSGSHIGYDAAGVLANSSSGAFDTSDFAGDTANALTRVMVLHPVAAGLSFISFLLALGAGVVGSFLAALVSLLTFIVTLVVLITDFVGFAVLKNAVNRADNGASAEFGACSKFFPQIFCTSHKRHHVLTFISQCGLSSSPPSATSSPPSSSSSPAAAPACTRRGAAPRSSATTALPLPADGGSKSLLTLPNHEKRNTQSLQ